MPDPVAITTAVAGVLQEGLGAFRRVLYPTAEENRADAAREFKAWARRSVKNLSTRYKNAAERRQRSKERRKSEGRGGPLGCAVLLLILITSCVRYLPEDAAHYREMWLEAEKDLDWCSEDLEKCQEDVEVGVTLPPSP